MHESTKNEKGCNFFFWLPFAITVANPGKELFSIQASIFLHYISSLLTFAAMHKLQSTLLHKIV